jgi:hypothetical protein
MLLRVDSSCGVAGDVASSAPELLRLQSSVLDLAALRAHADDVDEPAPGEPGRVATVVARPPVLFTPTPEAVRHPVDLAQPDRASARGQPLMHTAAHLWKLCPRADVW